MWIVQKPEKEGGFYKVGWSVGHGFVVLERFSTIEDAYRFCAFMNGGGAEALTTTVLTHFLEARAEQ